TLLREKMNTPRFGHSATLLNDGSILVAGGFSEPTMMYDQSVKARSSEVNPEWEAGDPAELADANDPVEVIDRTPVRTAEIIVPENNWQIVDVESTLADTRAFH